MKRPHRAPLLRREEYLDHDPAFAGRFDDFDDSLPVCSVVVGGARVACVSVGGDPAIDPYAGDPFVAEFVAACARIADARGHLDADDADHGDADDVDPHRPRVTDDGLTLDTDDTFGSDE